MELMSCVKPKPGLSGKKITVRPPCKLMSAHESTSYVPNYVGI